MQMHIDQRELKPTIDAIHFAIEQIYHDLNNGSLYEGAIVSRTIEQLKMLKLALMLGAAKEQRKGRANDVAQHSEFADTNKRLDNALRLMIR